MPKLIIQFQGQEWSVELREGPNTIGRSSKCTIPVRDVNMSREHCEVQLSGGVATVFDKGSMNGTLLNGTKVLERKLLPGDKIQIGASTIFFEHKKPGDAGPPVGAPLPAAAGGIDESTRPRPTATLPQKKTEARRSPALLLKDYSLWSRERGFPVAAVVAIVSVVAIGAIAYVLAGTFGGVRREQEDPDNLLAHFGRFETTDERGPAGWHLLPGLTSRIALDPNVAHGGRSSLVIEKTGDATDVVAECASTEEFALGDARRVTFSAWAKTEGFGGHVALKLAWTTTVRGPVLLEEYTVPLPKPAEWVQLSREFVVPPGAGAYHVALVAVGRSGRIFFDDARLTAKPGAEGPREATLAGFGFSLGSSGAFHVSTQNRRILANVHLALASDKEGVMPQTLAARAEARVEERRIQVEGKLLSPVDLREIGFLQQIIQDENDIVVAYTLSADALRQIERLLVVATVPRPERVSGLPAPNAGTVRVVARTEGLDVMLEYIDPTHVADSRERGGQKLVHVFPVDRSSAKVTIGFKIRTGAAGMADAAADDPLKAAEKEIARDNLSGAVAILKRHVGSIREPERRKGVLAEIARLEEQERGDWHEVQAACFKAWISRRGELFDAALQRTGVYQRQWSGEPYAAKSQPVRDDLEKTMLEAGSEREAERARRLLELARGYAQAGKRVLALELCDVLRERFAGTDAAQQAEDVRKSLVGD